MGETKPLMPENLESENLELPSSDSPDKTGEETIPPPKPPPAFHSSMNPLLARIDTGQDLHQEKKPERTDFSDDQRVMDLLLKEAEEGKNHQEIVKKLNELIGVISQEETNQ